MARASTTATAVDASAVQPTSQPTGKTITASTGKTRHAVHQTKNGHNPR